ncbi:uncharacterized protein MKK02DRAFT_42669 [Dioszegia hungarica]|uniref:Pali-domain-containing protein n=1 Tax=Dioszegia hungarica TaxID=4972 RepID=A0AA38LXT1_9TREE|nr:uncharacterized protein MKK02DRAFT_42669 [Dioszegia hungarica]KAI9638279.1 hypothetical protein MKK02DRAFT_42669 [Dioszegia hungarica]
MSSLTQRIPYGAHVIIIFVLSFAAFILVILTTFSTPFIQGISFLDVYTSSGLTRFGSFGWCNPGYCLPNLVSYEYAPQVNASLTGAMVLWPIAIIFTFFTLIAIIPLLFVHNSAALRYVGNSMFFKFSANLSAIITLVAWVMTIYGWSIAKRTFEAGGVGAVYGAATWLGLTAMLCMLIVAFLGWPHEAWDGKTTRANGGAGGRGLPGPGGDGYYHYKRTTREIVPQHQGGAITTTTRY